MDEESCRLLYPKGTRRLSHQIAGHSKTKFGMLKHTDGSVLKPLQGPPRGPRELSFYEMVFDENCTDLVLISLRALLPHFYGNLRMEFKNQELSFIKLEDITERFQNACILDVKIGPQTYDPDASLEKIMVEKKKYPPVEKIGYRILGMRVSTKSGVLILDKEYGKKLDETTILDGLMLFLDEEQGLQIDIVKQFLNSLQKVCDWFESQCQLAFYCSSLLLVYEGNRGAKIIDNPVEQGNIKWNAPSPMPLVEVRMIDFTHVFPTNCPDENYLFGVRNLISHFEQIYKRALDQSPHKPTLAD